MCFVFDVGFFIVVEGGVGWVGVVVVGLDVVGLNILVYVEGYVYVVILDVGIEIEFGVVGDGQCFCFVFEGGDGYYWFEDFFLEYVYFVVVFEQCGLDVIVVVVVVVQGFFVVVGEKLGVFVVCYFYIGYDFVELFLGGLGVYLYIGVQGVVVFNGFGVFQYYGYEFVVYVFLDQCSGWVGVDFVLVEECQYQIFYCFVDEFWFCFYDVGEVDVGGFIVQFYGGGNDVFCCVFEDV